MRLSLLLSTAFLLTSFAAAADAACDPHFTSHSEVVNVVGVTPGAGNVSVAPFEIRVRNDGGDDCAVLLRVSRQAPENALAPGYRLLSAGRQIALAPNEQTGTPSSDILVNASGGTNGSPVPFEIRLPTDWGLKAGDYFDGLQLSLVASDGVILDRLSVNVAIEIPPAVALALVGATGGGSGPAQINLGTLSSTEPTQSPPFGARVWSTSPYTVGFQSENHGSLARADGQDSIPYQLAIDNRAVDLSAGTANFPFAQYTSSQGKLHRIGIVVMPVHALAGDYSDRLTVSVTAM